MDNNDYEKKKSEILTDLFNSGLLNQRADGYFKGKLRFSRYTGIAEEIVLQTYLELCKYPAEKLVKRYEANPNSVIMLATVIMKYQLQHKKSNPESPNNSFGTKLIFGSSYFGGDYISPTDTYSESNETGDYHGIPIADVENGNFFQDRDNTPDRWSEIQKRLTDSEIEFVEALWNGQKFYKRKPTNEYKRFRLYLYNKIKNMNLNQNPSIVEQIRNKLEMADVLMFDVMWDEDLSMNDKMLKLKFSEQQYLSKRRIILKKIKALNIK